MMFLTGNLTFQIPQTMFIHAAVKDKAQEIQACLAIYELKKEEI